MVIRIKKNGMKPKTICISNSVLLNRASFAFVKVCTGIYYAPLLKIRYKSVKPLLAAVNEYARENPGFNFLEVCAKDGGVVEISF